MAEEEKQKNGVQFEIRKLPFAVLKLVERAYYGILQSEQTKNACGMHTNGGKVLFHSAINHDDRKANKIQ